MTSGEALKLMEKHKLRVTPVLVPGEERWVAGRMHLSSSCRMNYVPLEETASADTPLGAIEALCEKLGLDVKFET